MSGVDAATAIAIAGVAASAASTVASSQAGASASQSQSNMANYQAQVAKNNEQIAQQQAQYALASGQQQAANQSLAGASKFGAAKARQAANGININQGTAVDVQTSERSLNQLDSETVLANAQRQAYGYQLQGLGYGAQSGLDTSQAGLYSNQAGASGTGGLIGAGGTLLSGAKNLPLDDWFASTDPSVGGDPSGLATLTPSTGAGTGGGITIATE